MGEVTEADIRGMARQLVDDLPPDEVDQYRFRGAQFDRGLAYVQFPEGHGGLGLASRKLQTVVDAELRGAGVPYHDLAINPIGIGMGAPVVLTYASEEQKKRLLRPMYTGEEIWCQLFSEPGAGSDVAGLSTRAVRDGDEWVVNGQKVWTTLAHVSKWGMLVARTDPDQPKHKGMTYFLLDMESPGVDVRPLHQITGEAEFNEVFFDEVFVADDQLVGEENAGWSVSQSTLAHERGTNPRQLVIHSQLLDELIRLAERSGIGSDPRTSSRLAQAFVELRVFQLQNWRALSRLQSGKAPGGETTTAKLYWSEMSQRFHATAMRVLADVAPLWRGATGNPGDGRWQRSWLYYRAASIFAGTSEIQRTIIGERTLGLPRERRG